MPTIRYKFPPAQVVACDERKRAIRGRKLPDGTTEIQYESIGYYVMIDAGEQRLSMFLDHQKGALPVPGMIANITIEFTEAHDEKVR